MYPYGTTTTTTYVTVPQVYTRTYYHWEPVYNRHMPFAVPYGVPPHIAQWMMEASQIFRAFDLNYSGTLDYYEWLRAMQYMGYYMYDAEATRLFYMIDTDRSGQISEREFVAYYAHARGLGWSPINLAPPMMGPPGMMPPMGMGMGMGMGVPPPMY